MKLLQLSVLSFLMFRGTLELTVTNTISNSGPRLGETITLNCNIVNGIASSVIWYKGSDSNTKEIYMSHNCLVVEEEYKARLTNVKCDTNEYIFQLSNVEISDSGNWTCEANGEEATTLELDVLVPPLTPAVTNPSPIKVGDTANFTCNAENENVTKPVTYTWTKNGTTVSRSGTKEPGALLFSPVKKADAGKYVCVAKNDAGSKASTVQDFVVYFPPLTPAVKNPSPIKVGDTAKFTCNAENENVTKPVTYTWTKNGTTVSPGTTEPGALLFSPVKKADEGKYVCVAKNDAGSKTSTEEDFVVYFPPLTPAVTNPSPIKVGDTANFTCNAENENVTKPVTYTWTKNGTTVSRSGTKEPGTLLFSPVKKADAGKYVCVAKNDAGSKASTVQDFVVYYSPRIDPEAKMKYDVEGEIGKEASFELFIIAKPTPATTGYIWSKADIKLSNSLSKYEITSGSTSSKLSIKNVTSSDYDNYTCSVQTSGFQAMVFKFKLLKPGTRQFKVTNTISDLHPRLGETIMLNCNIVHGNANGVAWYKDKQFVEKVIYLSHNCFVIAEEYKSRLTNVKCNSNDYNFQLSNVDISDSGDWRCVADREEATTLRLDVLVPPLTPAVKNPSPIKVGDTAKFTCNAENENVTKPVTYTWTKNGTTVSPGTKEPGALLFSPVKKADEGKYVCVAKNDAGSKASTEEDFVVYFPLNVQVKINKMTVNEHGFVRFECATSGDNPWVIERYQWLWLKIGSPAEQVIQDTATSTQNGKFLEFTRIPYDRSGTYTCKAWILGRMEQESAFLNVQYSPRIDPEAKMKYDVVGEIGKDASFELFTIANPVPDTSGYVWSKDDNVPRKFSSGYKLISWPKTYSKLIIKNVTSSDYENYTCSVKTSGFQAKVFTFRLLKPEKPEASLIGVNRIAVVAIVCSLAGAGIIAITVVIMAVVLWQRDLLRLGKRHSHRPANNTVDYDDTRVEFTTAGIRPVHTYANIETDHVNDVFDPVRWRGQNPTQPVPTGHHVPVHRVHENEPTDSDDDVCAYDYATWQQGVLGQSPVPEPQQSQMECGSSDDEYGEYILSDPMSRQEGQEPEGTYNELPILAEDEHMELRILVEGQPHRSTAESSSSQANGANGRTPIRSNVAQELTPSRSNDDMANEQGSPYAHLDPVAPVTPGDYLDFRQLGSE
ncbi:hemicentin-1-like [Lineus longissimus]|uniref:hemicentin-1-like n=1 Tax=Lineus longissimus TaxID=88925 RepID=UPI00315DEDF1